jgi:3-oxoacyl-[acyl-carrier protein] reductase
METPVTLVSGARKGIGRSLVERYLEQGHFVVGCSRQESDLEHPNYAHHCTDVADEAGVIEMFSRIRKEQGRLDHVLNNAGIASMNHALLTPLDTVRAIFETNVMGTFLLCREGARVMSKRKYGRIVNFATVATPLRLEGEAAYAASKAAVVSLTEVLAREFAPFGITVNAVGPTPVPTDLIKSVPQEKMDALLARQAIKRFGTMDDVGNACDFFLRKESDFITSQTLYLGGV